MLTYLEEKIYQEAHYFLHQAQLKINYKYQMAETQIEAANISDEEKNNYFDVIINDYDQSMKQAEAEYDKVMNKIRSWKKVRRQG